MKNILEYIGTVLFIGLMLVKISAFHVYEHHDSVYGQHTQCELCVLTMESQQGETLMTPTAIVAVDLNIPDYNSDITPFDLPVITDPLKTTLFSRPPPSFI